MKFAVDAKTMKKIDEYTIEEVKLPALVLMERAALETVSLMKGFIKETDRILVVCGIGNNGGDGIATCRILALQGYHVAICILGERKKATEETRLQLEIASNLGIPIENSNKPGEYNIIVDAIFGIGLTRPVTGEYERVINNINDHKCTVVSIDIPSGISADTGKVMNVAIRADYTITFGYKKIGLLLYPGCEYAGKITVADIGFPKIALEKASPDTFYYQPNSLELMPKRKSYSNKGSYGKVLVIAGSKGMGGAAYLSAKAAYKTGAGMVKVLTSSSNREILQTALPEALFAAYDKEEDDSQLSNDILANIGWASVIVFGPGIGQSKIGEELLKILLSNAKVPIIIDADGLNILAKWLDKRECMDLESRINMLADILPEETILTPHLMELSRLTCKSIEDISDNIIDTGNQCSYNNKIIFALKDARTIVTQQGIKYINLSGNDGMATAGSGDVLTGIIAGLIAQGMKPFEGCCMAVYLHGLSGDEAIIKTGKYSLMAGDIIEAIEKVINKRS